MLVPTEHRVFWVFGMFMTKAKQSKFYISLSLAEFSLFSVPVAVPWCPAQRRRAISWSMTLGEKLVPAVGLAGLGHGWHFKGFPRAARLPPAASAASDALPGLLGFFPVESQPLSPGVQGLSICGVGVRWDSSSWALLYSGAGFQSLEHTRTDKTNDKGEE